MLRSAIPGCRESAIVPSIFRRGIDFEFEASSVTIADYAASESFCSGPVLLFTCRELDELISATAIVFGFQTFTY